MTNTIIYFKESGKCVALFSFRIEDVADLYPDAPQEYTDNLGKIEIDHWIDYHDYKVVDGKLVEVEADVL